MTTFTITCPPTVAASTNLTSSSTSGNWGALYSTNAGGGSVTIGHVVGEGSGQNYFSERTDTDSNCFVLHEVSDSYSISYSSANSLGGGNVGDFPATVVSETTEGSTFSWNGARTLGRTNSNGQTQTIWTASQATSSRTTSTQTDTVYQTTLTETTNLTTRSGTTIQTGTMVAPEPRTTVAQTEGVTTKTADLSTTRLTTTTEQDTFNRWRTGEGGSTHRGTFQSATVVCLETSNLGNLRPELAWIVTERPTFTATSTAAAQQQGTTQFTVFPSLVPTAGRVEQATYDTDAEQFTFSTSSEVIETPTTYKTTTQTANTITVASQFTALPSPLSQQVGTTISTQNWFSTIQESRFTGGDTSTTTVFSTTTHQGSIGGVTWNATHQRSTTARTSFALVTAGSKTEAFNAIWPAQFEQEFDDAAETDIQLADIETVNGAAGATTTATFSRPVSVVAQVTTATAAQNQCGSSLSFAVAAASNLNSAAQEMGAADISITMPQSVTVAAARTARTPLGSWSYVTGGSTGTTISVSAGPASLSVTSTFGPASARTTESTEGAWTLEGAAVSRANLPAGQRLNVGGVAATGTATAFYDAGIFSTSDANGSGTVEVTEARTEIINPAAARTAYLPATGVFINGGKRYDTTHRNITQTIAESAIITERSQLIL